MTTGCESCAMEGARLRCPWAAVGPAGQHTATSRAGVEGTARPAGPGRTTHRHPDRLEAAARPAGPGRASSRRAERSSRRGRLAGGQAARRPEICRGNKQRRKTAAHAYTEQPGPPNSTRDARNTRGAATPVGPQHHTAAHQPNTPRRHNKTARPHRGRAAQPISVTHRRITTMSGSPRPLSWRTLEMPSLAATSFAVPSMRRSS